MKNIKKLKLPYDDGKGNFSSGAGVIQIIRKVNEIIDYLDQPKKQQEVKKDSEMFIDNLIRMEGKQEDSEEKGELNLKLKEALWKDFNKLYVKE